jgi:hypothetical protein
MFYVARLLSISKENPESHPYQGLVPLALVKQTVPSSLPAQIASTIR